jgi:methionyl-tRNA synthetase
MSKTIGNIVDPNDLAAFFGADALRYLMLKEIAFDRDGDFTVELFVTRYNAELANELGNLFSRTLSMTNRYLDGAVPPWSEAAAADVERLTGGVLADYRDRMDGYHFDEALAALWRAVQGANRYVEERKPWAQAKAGDDEALAVTLRTLLEVLQLASVLCRPFMPEKAREMRAQLGLGTDFAKISLDDAGTPGSADWKTVGKPEVLFPKLEVPAEG